MKLLVGLMTLLTMTTSAWANNQSDANCNITIITQGDGGDVVNKTQTVLCNSITTDPNGNLTLDLTNQDLQRVIYPGTGGVPTGEGGPGDGDRPGGDLI